MNDVILIAMEHWDAVWRRVQNIAVGIARRFPARKVLFVTLPADLSNAVRHGDWSRVGQLATRACRPAPPSPTAAHPNVFVFTPVKIFPHTLSLGRLANQAMTRAQVRAAAAQIGLCDPLLYINPYYAAHMVGRMGESAVVYDVGEDWSHIEPRPWLRRQMTAEDDLLTRRADAVIVVSEHLEQLKRPVAKRVRLVPNGVYAERYRDVATRRLEPHPITRDWPRPVLGHTGTLQSRRTDVDLLLEIARAFPHGTVALVGPNSLEPACDRRLRAAPNVRMTGHVDFAEVPRVMTAFDACIVPQQVNAFTESQNPLKMFEYFASGLPIVSTPIAGFRDYPQVVRLADTAPRFTAAIHDALAEPATLVDVRQRLAAQHTWDRRLDAIIDVCEGCLRDRAAGRAEPNTSRSLELTHAC